MFGLLMIFGQLRAEPWYGKNVGLMQDLTTDPYHIQLTWCHLLSVPGLIAASPCRAHPDRYTTVCVLLP